MLCVRYFSATGPRFDVAARSATPNRLGPIAKPRPTFTVEWQPEHGGAWLCPALKMNSAAPRIGAWVWRAARSWRRGCRVELGALGGRWLRGSRLRRRYHTPRIAVSAGYIAPVS